MTSIALLAGCIAALLAKGIVVSAVASDAVKGPGGKLAVADLERWVGTTR